MARAALPIAEHAARLARHFTVARPEGPGPYPVVIHLHGCGGRQAFHDTYASAALAAGYASVVVDSFTPRRISRRAAQLTVCTGLRLRGAERSADVFAALHWLAAQPWADSGRVALAGWSHGGWTAMDALAGAHGAGGLTDHGSERLANVRAAFLVYPYAGIPSLTLARGWGAHRPRVYAVLAGRDAVVGHITPRRTLDRLAGDGLAVEVLMLEGATHSFDDPDADDPRSRYSPGQAGQARAFFIDALGAAFTD